MKIDIWKVNIPSHYENMDELKNLIGNSKVKAYSINLKDNSIVAGEGWIASNESYNYHNNYDDSEDCMWFDGEQQWFTLNYERVLEVQRENNKIILDVLEPIVNKAKENI
jgi:hypothetical protein